MNPTLARTRSPLKVAVVLAVWLAAALMIGAVGVLARLPVPPPALAIALTVATLLLLWWSPAARASVQRLGLHALVAFHLTRLAAGTYFLVLYGRGVLPASFAVPAGWGDIAVALGALIVLGWCLPATTRGRRVCLLAWNAVGLLDILGVLANGVRLFLADPGLAVPFTTLPLALLPTFVVPLVITSHVLLFAWVRPPSAPASPAARRISQ